MNSIIELIENLEYVERKNPKDLNLPHYGILHWCYAVLRKDEIVINKEIKANNKYLLNYRLYLMYTSLLILNVGSLSKSLEKFLTK